MQATYVLPIRRSSVEDLGELTGYLADIARWCDVIVVDGSPAPVFAVHHATWAATVTHLAPDPDLGFRMGKVDGVVTGLRHARSERIVIADDDVRYDLDGFRRVIALLDEAAVVRPQNYFSAMPWHAYWDTGRSLLNRCFGGDWPGTLGVRRSVLLATDGYDGDVMFENLELVRTVQAAGGRMVTPLDLYVARLPPTTGHFLGQRVRQAYDEFARPSRLAAFLTLVPAAGWATVRGRWAPLVAATAATAGLAEIGRRRAGGTAVFPAAASLCAPLWVAERAVCAWLAVASRLRWGGVRYGTSVIPRAATSKRTLRRRHASAFEQAA